MSDQHQPPQPSDPQSNGDDVTADSQAYQHDVQQPESVAYQQESGYYDQYGQWISYDAVPPAAAAQSAPTAKASGGLTISPKSLKVIAISAVGLLALAILAGVGLGAAAATMAAFDGPNRHSGPNFRMGPNGDERPGTQRRGDRGDRTQPVPSPSASSEQTPGGRGGGLGSGGLGGGGLGALLAGGLSDFQHGDIVTRSGAGAATTQRIVRGTVLATSATAITVRSADGFTATYAVNANTVKPTTVAVGANVVVVGTVVGKAVTATRILALPAAVRPSTPVAPSPSSTA